MDALKPKRVPNSIEVQNQEGIITVSSNMPEPAGSDLDYATGSEDDVEMGNDECGSEELIAEDDGAHNSAETNKFDQIIGELEGILLDYDSESVVNRFCTAHCHHFEDSDENKLMYTPLFQQYCELLETTLDTKLKAQVPGFSMAEFSAMLTDRQDELMSEVFDLLLSMADFQAFKDLMVSYKQQAAQASPLALTCHAAPLRTPSLVLLV